MGVVSIPSALIANGFVDIVQSKIKAKNARAQGTEGNPTPGVAGDDWYEIAYRQLANVDPPPSKWGPQVDKYQIMVNEFLNGKADESGNVHFTPVASVSRGFIFTVIILNIVAVLLESVPTIDRRVGNEKGNLFDVFECFSVMVFAVSARVGTSRELHIAFNLTFLASRPNMLQDSFVLQRIERRFIQVLFMLPPFLESSTFSQRHHGSLNRPCWQQVLSKQGTTMP